MKYTMETDDSKEFIQHYNGPALYGVIQEFQNFLQEKVEYLDPENGAWDDATQELTLLLIEYGIDMKKDYS